MLIFPLHVKISLSFLEDNIMEWIQKYINGAAIAGIVIFLTKYLIQKTIDSYFNKQLENHKRELAVITENAKYDISKKLFDFQAYASKRHTIYPELYRIAYGLLSELSRFGDRINLIKDIEADIDKNELRSRFREGHGPILDRLLNAHDYFYKNELYVSENTATAYKEVLTRLRILDEQTSLSFNLNISNVYWQDPNFLLIENKNHRLKAKEKIDILKETMYKELSYTHSEEIIEKEKGLS